MTNQTKPRTMRPVEKLPLLQFTPSPEIYKIFHEYCTLHKKAKALILKHILKEYLLGLEKYKPNQNQQQALSKGKNSLQFRPLLENHNLFTSHCLKHNLDQKLLLNHLLKEYLTPRINNIEKEPFSH